jgi:hypothetical protein
MTVRSPQDKHIKLTPSLLAALHKLHPQLVAARGVQHFSDTIRMALARGIKHLEIELESDSLRSSPRRDGS